MALECFSQTHLVFLKELRRESPRCVSQDFVHVAAMPQGFIAFVFRHDCETLVLVGQLIAAHCSRSNGEKTHEHRQKHQTVMKSLEA